MELEAKKVSMRNGQAWVTFTLAGRFVGTLHLTDAGAINSFLKARAIRTVDDDAAQHKL